MAEVKIIQVLSSVNLLNILLKTVDKHPELDYNIPVTIKVWSHGQAVKTSPFHGGNRGSIPLGTTNNNSH